MNKLRDWLVKPAGRAARYVTHNLALKWRLMLMLSVLIIVSFSVLGYISVRIYTDNIISQTIARKHELGSSTMEAISIIRIRDEYSSNQIVKNDIIMGALSYDGPQTEYQKFLEIRDSTKALIELVDQSNIVGLAVLGKNGKTFYSMSETSGSRFSRFKDLVDDPRVASSSGENIWLPYGTDIVNSGSGKAGNAALYVVHKLNNTRNSKANDDVGLSVMQVQYSRFTDILSRTTPGAGEYAMLADGYGEILCSTRSQFPIASKLPADIFSPIGASAQGSYSLGSGSGRVLYLYNRDAQTGWTMIQAIPYGNIASAADEVRRWSILLVALCLVGALSLAWLFARSFTNPVVRLEKVMKKFGGGELSVRSPADRSDEIGHLQQSFNNLATQINGLLEGMEEEHRQKRMMEIRMLEYQINPHFLYNSLDSINWMASSTGNREISEMAAALAKFFRIGLNKGREVVSVADEVEHARNYLIISKIRYHDGFSFSVSVDPEVRECRTIKLIIQPLVENTLVHAIKKSGEGGRIDIRAFPKGDKVAIEVEDNGKGIPPDKLESIRAMLMQKLKGDDYDGGIGMMNVQQRIRLNYGMDYGLEVESTEGVGTTVRIIIPKVH